MYTQAGITDPRKDIDCVEIYVPFSWYEPMWLENLGFAPRATAGSSPRTGATALDGDLPLNPSGGVLSSNPIGASRHDPLRRGRAAGARAGRRAPGRRCDRKALGHAYGGGSQFFAMWVVGNKKPE